MLAELSGNDVPPAEPSPAVDLLTEAVEAVRPLLTDPERHTGLKVRILWIAAKKAADTELATSDVIVHEFFELAVDVGMIDGTTGQWLGDDLSESVRRYGAQDVAHTLHRAVRGRSPFAEASA